MPEIPAHLAAEAAALRRLIGLASGSPAFAFAVCNTPGLRRDIIAQVPSADVAVADLPADTLDPVATARALIPEGHPGAAFITGLERLLSEANPDSAAFLARLNRSRERWRSAFPARLLVFWVSDQAFLRILQAAPDFRAWVSHELDFTEPATGMVASARTERAPVLSTEEAARRAAAISARLAIGSALPPVPRLALIRELLRLAPAGEAVRALVEEGIDEALLSLRQRVSEHPEESGALRDLTGALHQVADSYVELGNSSAALRRYHEALTIRERLAASDPGNAGWQRDLSVSLNKLGELAVAQGDLAGALERFTESKAIRERLAASDPGNAG